MKNDNEKTVVDLGEVRRQSASGPGDAAPEERAGARHLIASAREANVDGGSDIHETLDHTAQVWLSRFTHGLSPAALMGAWFDWATHIAAAPGKRLQLAEKATDQAIRQARSMIKCATTTDETKPCINPLPQDKRFSDDAWQTKPFNMIYQSFLLQQQWWHHRHGRPRRYRRA